MFASIRPGVLFANRFEVRQRLGSGGAGEVFHVFDRLAGEEAALKILFPGPDRGAGLERLRRELKLARDLEHPGIVRIRDIGEHDGLLYLLMPLLTGETLKLRLARGPLRVDDALRLFDGVLEALAFAHASGVVHRDVKPANVFLVPRLGGGERVVLLDFGLARHEDQPSLTVTGQFLGTPEYASPEQARGERAIGPDSDVYSAGIVLWEMLAGRPPFSGENSLEILLGHTSRPLPSPRRIAGAVPPWLRDLLIAMLEKEPRRRPADAGAARAMLQLGSRRSLRARGAALVRRMRWRRSLLLAATGAVLLVAAAGLALWPLGVEADGDSALRTSCRAGFVAHRFQFPGSVTKVVPLGEDWWTARRRLVALRPNAQTKQAAAIYPERLVEIDLLTGSMRRFALKQSNEDWSKGPPHGIPRFDRDMLVTGLERVPYIGVDGKPRLVATWAHAVHYPSVAAAFGMGGDVDWVLTHPGRLGGDISFGEREASVYPGVHTVLFHGVNNALSGRHVVVGINDSFHPNTPPLYNGSPFDERSRLGPGDRMPNFETFCSTVLPHASLAVSGRSGRLVLGGTTAFAFEATSGIPAEGFLPPGIGAERWERRQIRLRTLLGAAASAERDGHAADVARDLRLFADGEGLDASQRGVALARAAELFRSAGLFEEGLAAARDAMAAEPELPGHLRLFVDLSARLGRWTETRRVLSLSPVVEHASELGRDAVIAALITGSVEQARSVAAPRDESDYGRFEHALIALHEGEPARAIELLSRDEDAWPESALLRAIALASLDTPRCSEAVVQLKVAEAGEGSGWSLPFVPLRAYLARRCGTDPPAAADVERALDGQRRAARTNIVDLYFLAWGERLAHGTPLRWVTLSP